MKKRLPILFSIIFSILLIYLAIYIHTFLNIEKNMTEDSWDVQHCPDYILNILAQFGEVIELKPIVARRLVANLATELVKRRLEATDPFGDLI